MRHRDALHQLLEERFLTAPAEHWVRLLTDRGVPVGPVNDLQEALDDPVVAERRVVATGPDGRPAGVRLPVDPGTSVRRPPPELGAHTAEVLQEWLGRSGAS